MYLIVFGAPGVGKGTQAKFISTKFNIAHLSTGEMLREAVKNETDLGKRAGELIAQGKLVADQIMLELIADRISRPDCEDGFILDGFPRTIVQAEGLENLMQDMNLPALTCIDIVVPTDAIITRLVNRRLCDSCGTDYNLVTNPPAENMICNVCGGHVIQREDDHEETISNRMNIYQQQTAPLRQFYKNKGKYHKIDGSRSITEVQSEIFKIIKV